MALAYGAGLALLMYPAELLKYGALHSGEAVDAVDNEHFFLCLQADAREGLWTPLHATRGQDRVLIPETAKSGYPDFVRGLTFYSPDVLWRIPHKAAKKAAEMARDRSSTVQANRVSTVPALASFRVAAPVAD